MNAFARIAATLALSAVALTGCGAFEDLDDTPPPMGRFLLGHNIVLVDEDMEIGPFSREVPRETWIEPVRKAINDRFSRYDGDQYYHIGVNIIGYVLAIPGLPMVATPKSLIIATVNVYSDADGGKPVNPEPETFTVFEQGDVETMLVGSGISRTAEEQQLSLANALARQIQLWMLKNPEWFGDPSLMDPATTSPGRPIQPLPPMPGSN